MHERSLVRGLLRQVNELKRKHGANRVITVEVSVGEFSGVEAELLRSAFAELVEDSPIRGAELHLSRVALEACCHACACEFPVQNFRFQCPDCGSGHIRTLRGERLTLESVTLE